MQRHSTKVPVIMAMDDNSMASAAPGRRVEDEVPGSMVHRRVVGGTRALLLSGLAIGGAVLFACQAVGPMAAAFGRNILDAAAGNYSNHYSATVNEMMAALSKPAAAVEEIKALLQQNPSATEAGLPENAEQASTTDDWGSTTTDDDWGSTATDDDWGSTATDDWGSTTTTTDDWGSNTATTDTWGNSTATADNWGAAGGNETTAQTSWGTPLRVDFEILRERVQNNRADVSPVADGDVLYDGGGDAQGGDSFKLVVRPHTSCSVYVIAVDATGWVQPVYPVGLVGGFNPVAAGAELEIPSGREWFFLDEYRGVETFYLLASTERNLQLEDVLRRLADLASEGRPEPGPARVANADVLMRGIAGRRTERSVNVTSSNGTSVDVSPASFLNTKGTGDLLVTRWFKHQ